MDETTIYKTLHRKLEIQQQTRTPQKTEGELRCSVKVGSSCSTCKCVCNKSEISHKMQVAAQNTTEDNI